MSENENSQNNVQNEINENENENNSNLDQENQGEHPEFNKFMEEQGHNDELHEYNNEGNNNENNEKEENDNENNNNDNENNNNIDDNQQEGEENNNENNNDNNEVEQNNEFNNNKNTEENLLQNDNQEQDEENQKEYDDENNMDNQNRETEEHLEKGQGEDNFHQIDNLNENEEAVKADFENNQHNKDVSSSEEIINLSLNHKKSLQKTNNKNLVTIEPRDLTEQDYQSLMEWLSQIKFSQKNVFKNIQRNFADGVLYAEILKHFFPKFVEMHNYIPTLNKKKMQINWVTVNHKLVRKLSLEIKNSQIQRIINMEKGYIEKHLFTLKDKVRKKKIYILILSS